MSWKGVICAPACHDQPSGAYRNEGRKATLNCPSPRAAYGKQAHGNSGTLHVREVVPLNARALVAGTAPIRRLDASAHPVLRPFEAVTAFARVPDACSPPSHHLIVQHSAMKAGLSLLSLAKTSQRNDLELQQNDDSFEFSYLLSILSEGGSRSTATLS